MQKEKSTLCLPCNQGFMIILSGIKNHILIAAFLFAVLFLFYHLFEVS